MCVSVCIHIHTIYSLSFPLLIDIGCFHVLAIVNSTAMNIWVHVSFYFSGYMPMSGIAGSYGNRCSWHHPYGRKQRRTKEPFDESERGELA